MKVRVVKGELRGFIFFGYIYIYIVENIKICCRQENRVDFSEVMKEGFSLFITKRLKYDEAKGKRGYIFHLLLDVKRRERILFLRGTFEVVEEGKY